MNGLTLQSPQKPYEMLNRSYAPCCADALLELYLNVDKITHSVLPLGSQTTVSNRDCCNLIVVCCLLSATEAFQCSDDKTFLD